MFKRDRKSQMVDVPFGERTMYEYFDEDGQPMRVLDFTYLPVGQY